MNFLFLEVFSIIIEFTKQLLVSFATDCSRKNRKHIKSLEHLQNPRVIRKVHCSFYKTILFPMVYEKHLKTEKHSVNIGRSIRRIKCQIVSNKSRSHFCPKNGIFAVRLSSLC